MGADSFRVFKIGSYKTVDEAFEDAVNEAQHEYGHGGYTGTIAEKMGEKLIRFEGPKESIDDETETCDKWGAVKYYEVSVTKELKEKYGLKRKRNVKAYIFFGIASC